MRRRRRRGKARVIWCVPSLATEVNVSFMAADAIRRAVRARVVLGLHARRYAVSTTRRHGNLGKLHGMHGALHLVRRNVEGVRGVASQRRLPEVRMSWQNTRSTRPNRSHDAGKACTKRSILLGEFLFGWEVRHSQRRTRSPGVRRHWERLRRGYLPAMLTSERCEFVSQLSFHASPAIRCCTPQCQADLDFEVIWSLLGSFRMREIEVWQGEVK